MTTPACPEQLRELGRALADAADPQTCWHLLRVLADLERASPPPCVESPTDQSIPPETLPATPRGPDLAWSQPARLTQLARRYIAGALAGTLTHELSQPLAAIAMYSDAAAQLAASGRLSAEELAQVLGRIGTQVERAGEMLARVRAVTSDDNADDMPCDLCRTLIETVALMRPQAANKQVAIHLDLPVGPVWVAPGCTPIGQAVLNLLFNSIAAIDRAGSAQREVRVSVRSDPTGVRVTVSDSGPGIKAEDAERIFEGFVSDGADGCGLGLAISRSLIEALGGRLWVDPRAAGGAVLHLWLPGSPGP